MASGRCRRRWGKGRFLPRPDNGRSPLRNISSLTPTTGDACRAGKPGKRNYDTDTCPGIPARHATTSTLSQVARFLTAIHLLSTACSRVRPIVRNPRKARMEVRRRSSADVVRHSRIIDSASSRSASAASSLCFPRRFAMRRKIGQAAGTGRSMSVGQPLRCGRMPSYLQRISESSCQNRRTTNRIRSVVKRRRSAGTNRNSSGRRNGRTRASLPLRDSSTSSASLRRRGPLLSSVSPRIDTVDARLERVQPTQSVSCRLRRPASS
jgi:hypothetical protein